MQYQITPKKFRYKYYKCEIKECPNTNTGIGLIYLPPSNKYFCCKLRDIPIKCHGELVDDQNGALCNYAKMNRLRTRYILQFEYTGLDDFVPPESKFMKILKSTTRNLADATFKDNEFIENELKNIIDQF